MPGRATHYVAKMLPKLQGGPNGGPGGAVTPELVREMKELLVVLGLLKVLERA